MDLSKTTAKWSKIKKNKETVQAFVIDITKAKKLNLLTKIPMFTKLVQDLGLKATSLNHISPLPVGLLKMPFSGPKI